MNTISWLIYLAEVLQNLGNTFSGITFASSILAVIFSILTITSFTATAPSEVAYYGFRFLFKKLLIIDVVALIVVVVLNVVVPSKNTMMMIAASQTTEQVAASPQGKEVLDHLKTLINKKLSDMEK